ncbi:MAG: RloB family protein [Lachnospiraceae bacterium]|nr:RloB family protein [Lachnospiraceae bacterium]
MARKSDRLTARNIFYIITNGEQTEKNYFRLLKAKHSVYDVKVIFQNDDPIGLVQYASTLVKDANQVWCVFDIDYTHQEKRLIPALKKAEESGVKIAYSNIAFEVWLISHYEKCEKTLQINDYQKELDRVLKENGERITYSKTDETMLKSFFVNRYKQAVENAKVVYQKLVREYNETHKYQERLPIWKWNSSTTVYKLVEALKLRD